MPIRWRLTLFIALVIGAILLILGFALYFMSRSALLAAIEDTTRGRALAAADAIESEGELSEDEHFSPEGVVVIVRDGSGEVIQTLNLARGQNGAPPPAKEEGGRGRGGGGGEAAEEAVWRKALGSGEAASGTAEFAGGDPYYVYAVPVEPPGAEAPRVVEAARSYEPALETLEVFATVLAAGIGAAFVLSIGGAYLLAGAALRPIDAVTSAAREMGEGDLSKRLPVANPADELGRLVATINALLSRLEAAFARREEALERQRRFAADASHELRTPLTAISGHARMLDEWALEEDPQRARRSVGVIRREAGRMRNLVESLLALTRGDEGARLEIGHHDLCALAGEAAQAARDAAEGKVSVEYTRPEREIAATFDRDRILQAASILLDNAVKYTPEGGSVALRLREEGEEEEEEGRRVALEVSDTGVGIPHEQLPLIFERFHRTDPSRADGGAGLGLSIARQIAESHGGEIRAKSVPGEGSTFTLLLPYRPSFSGQL